jgi:protein CpxP
MTRISHVRAAALLAALSLPAFSMAAMAQTSPAATTAPVAATVPALPKAMSAKVEQHIKELHDQLHITAAEEPQWQAFALVMRDNAAEMQHSFTDRGSQIGAMDAADNMQSYAQLAQVHATNTQKLASAFQSLYNSFPDDQKRLADGVFRNNRAMHGKH